MAAIRLLKTLAESPRPTLCAAACKAVKSLHALADPKRAKGLARFFKTGPGEYGEGDQFLGVMNPHVHSIVKEHWEALSLRDMLAVLHSEYNEQRLLALLMMAKYSQHKQGLTAEQQKQRRKEVFDEYCAHIDPWICNWNLVDCSCPQIVGEYLCLHESAEQAHSVLLNLAKSSELFVRRVAVVSTLSFIRNGKYSETLKLCEALLDDSQDLMHKACGWMLREVGKGSEATLKSFLTAHGRRMPRVMLRYAIERLDADTKHQLLAAPSDKLAPSRRKRQRSED